MTITAKNIPQSFIERVMKQQLLTGYVMPEDNPSDSFSVWFDDGQADAQVFLMALGFELDRAYGRAAAMTFAEDARITINGARSALYAPGWKTLEG